MGWDFYHRAKGETDRDHFAAHVLGENHPIVECATVGLTFYAAVLDGDEVTAVVALMRRGAHKGMDSYFNFGYKLMDETGGPFDYDCPAKVLDALTPLPDCDHGDELNDRYCGTCNARAWRDGSRVRAARKAAAREVKTGTVIKLAAPLSFGKRYGEYDTFRKLAKRGQWAAIRDGAAALAVRGLKLADYEYEVVTS